MDEMQSATDVRLKPRGKRTATESATALPDSISINSVESYLRNNLDPDARVSELRVLSGGRSKQTILLTLDDSSGNKVERIIRRDLSTSPTGGTVPEEYAVLVVLADRGVPVPRPLLCEPDPTKLGSPFIIVKKIPGSLSGHIFDPPGSVAILETARILGYLHSLSVAEIAPTIREKFRIAPGTEKIRSQILELKKSWDQNARAECLTINIAFEWLLNNVDNVEPLTSVVHGDFSFHNILLSGDKVTAVLDWELVRVGHPAEDLAYIRDAVLTRMKWEEFMQAYLAGGGLAVDTRDMFFYTLMEKLRLIDLLFRSRSHFESGLTDDLELVDAMIILMPRLVQQVSTELRAYLEKSGSSM